MRIPALALLACSLFARDQLSNRRAPGFSLPDAQFTRYDLQDYRGKWLLLDFTQTSCPFCKQLARILEDVKRNHGDRAAILQIVLPPDDTAKVAAYIADQRITVPVVFDQGQMAASYFNATPKNPTFDTPHLFIINPKGTIVADLSHEDPDLLDPVRLQTLLARLMKTR